MTTSAEDESALTPITVSLPPKLLAALETLSAVSGSLPSAARGAIRQWAEASGLIEHHPRMKEVPVMIFLTRDELTAVAEVTGLGETAEAIEHLVRDHLTGLGGP